MTGRVPICHFDRRFIPTCLQRYWILPKLESFVYLPPSFGRWGLKPCKKRLSEISIVRASSWTIFIHINTDPIGRNNLYEEMKQIIHSQCKTVWGWTSCGWLHEDDLYCYRQAHAPRIWEQPESKSVLCKSMMTTFLQGYCAIPQ